MEITLEQIDLIRQRTGAGYKEAREALERPGAPGGCPGPAGRQREGMEAQVPSWTG
jgi:hypothetical protein